MLIPVPLNKCFERHINQTVNYLYLQLVNVYVLKINNSLVTVARIPPLHYNFQQGKACSPYL